MGLQALAVSSGATLAPSGGSTLTFAPDGQTVQNGVSLIVPADPLFTTRRRCVFKYAPATVVQSTGGYKRESKSVSYTQPIVLANGQIAFNTIRVTREVHPEMTASNALDLNIVGAQLLFDSDVTSFWAYGSVL